MIGEWPMLLLFIKKGSHNNLSNYRPVSLTSVICKIMESIIRDGLMEHLTSYKLITDEQFGFVPYRSCSFQLLSALNQWTNLLQNGNPRPVAARYCIFHKAFDSVPHERLLSKLFSYGIEGKLHGWLRELLTCRSQSVVLNGLEINA